jgi:radical SAM protein with 4Fe4S-binding SPASM domain
MVHAADLRLVFWETTAACNLTCKHCRRIEVAQDPDQLGTEEAKRIISEIASVSRSQPSAGKGPPTIMVFSGGEPLMRADVWELAAHARASGLAIALATNGTLVDDAMAARIRDVGFQRVSISLDGSNPATHDAFRGLDGSFASACAGLERLRAAGVQTQVNCTVARHNRDQLPAMRELSIWLGASALHLFMVVPVGCGVQLGERERLSASEIEEALTWLARQELDPRLFVKATCAPQYYRIRAQLGVDAHHPGGGHAGLNAMTRGCLAGSGVCFISHKGVVFPCGYLPIACGDLRQQGFADVWRASPEFGRLRDVDLLGGACGSCGYRELCGGCRARAYAVTGDHLGAEPDCVWGGN